MKNLTEKILENISLGGLAVLSAGAMGLSATGISADTIALFSDSASWTDSANYIMGIEKPPIDAVLNYLGGNVNEDLDVSSLRTGYNAITGLVGVMGTMASLGVKTALETLDDERGGAQ